MYLKVGRTADGLSSVGQTDWFQYINAYYAGNNKSLKTVEKTSKSHSKVPSSENQLCCTSGIGSIVFSDRLRESSDTLPIAGKLVRAGLRVLLVGDEVGGKGACREYLGDTVVISNQVPCTNKDYRDSLQKLTNAVEGEPKLEPVTRCFDRYERGSHKTTTNTRCVCLQLSYTALVVPTDTSLTRVQRVG